MELAKTGNAENGNISREEIQAAIAKAVELRALHAALMQQGNSPSSHHLRFRSSPHHSSQFSGHDYPVFTPSYEDEPLPGYGHMQITNQTISENWDEIRGNQSGLSTGLDNNNHHVCPTDDCKSVASSCTNEGVKSRRRNSLGDLRSVSSCNNWMILSWLFKRRQKTGNSSPLRTDDQSEEVSQVLKDYGSSVSIETLKKELIDANQKKEAALMEVTEMRSSFGELRKKLENLESYCEELKKALRQAVSKRPEISENKVKREKAGDEDDSMMPVSKEVMVEGFLQIVSEARLSVKQFCKTMIEQIEESDEQLTQNLNLILKPYKLSINSRYSKSVFYHIEAIVNQAFYQDFENCVFQKNGIQKLLDPQQQRQAQFQSFASLRNLSWNEVLKKGTKYYSEEFSKFCDQKMSCIIMTLNWTRPWSETLLQSFFVSAKCIWLLHLLAFSFFPALNILRVEENRSFDACYMEDIVTDKQKGHGPSRVKVMVMPGFYVQDKILRCKVLCMYKSVV
ncbi:IRK-interacting protein isoform X2 [Spinacia oleracea]|uniref:IRK-interacting protein isoform X2 n=1 Tax=Spinacia oleracea TaxID=3562 RepID=A0A9R0K905_SPIOL|nr:IRK-interacting protein isoform X2 [Spinacia oleracea]